MNVLPITAPLIAQAILQPATRPQPPMDAELLRRIEEAEATFRNRAVERPPPSEILLPRIQPPPPPTWDDFKPERRTDSFANTYFSAWDGLSEVSPPLVALFAPEPTATAPIQAPLIQAPIAAVPEPLAQAAPTAVALERTEVPAAAPPLNTAPVPTYYGLPIERVDGIEDWVSFQRSELGKRWPVGRRSGAWKKYKELYLPRGSGFKRYFHIII